MRVLGGLIVVAVAAAGVTAGANVRLGAADIATAPPDGDTSLETASIAPRETMGRFVLTSMDDGQSCVVEKGMEADGLASVVAGSDCERLLPGLSAVTSWRQGADGSVTLGSETAMEMARFSQADGAAYESFHPVTPLLVLGPAD
ncbi:MAG: hypothetical protein AB7I79_02390 [Rhizobiaceae bacterium]